MFPAELMPVLADARLELADVQTTLANKDARIEELELAFEEKGTLIRHNDAYYNMDSEGNAVGVAFCLRCWEGDHKIRQLVVAMNQHNANVCTSCDQKYDAGCTNKIAPIDI